VTGRAQRATASRRESQVKRRPTGRVRMTKPAAIRRKMAGKTSGRNSIIFFMTTAASATPIAAATVVFLVSATITLPRGAMADLTACGRTTSRRVEPKLSPMALAASTWPAGIVLKPLRTASQTKEAW
jgi:hypothetical protein